MRVLHDADRLQMKRMARRLLRRRPKLILNEPWMHDVHGDGTGVKWDGRAETIPRYFSSTSGPENV